MVTYMQYSCRVPSSAPFQTPQSMKDSQSSVSCHSSHSAPKAGSGRESWRLGRPSKIAQRHRGGHTSSGRALCVWCHLVFPRKISATTQKCKNTHCLLRKRGWPTFPLYSTFVFPLFSQRRRIESTGGVGYPCSNAVWRYRVRESGHSWILVLFKYLLLWTAIRGLYSRILHKALLSLP